MTRPAQDELANCSAASCELSLEELETVAAGGFWSTLRHAAEQVGHVAYYVGVGLAIFGGIFGGIQAAAGALPQRNTNVN